MPLDWPRMEVSEASIRQWDRYGEDCYSEAPAFASKRPLLYDLDVKVTAIIDAVLDDLCGTLDTDAYEGAICAIPAGPDGGHLAFAAVISPEKDRQSRRHRGLWPRCRRRHGNRARRTIGNLTAAARTAKYFAAFGRLRQGGSEGRDRCWSDRSVDTCGSRALPEASTAGEVGILDRSAETILGNTCHADPGAARAAARRASMI